MYDDDFGLYYLETSDNLKKETTSDSKAWCSYVWYPIILIRSTVWNCKKCDCKKEDYEKQYEVPKWGGL